MTKQFSDFNPPLGGLVFITGSPDAGKTTFCLTAPGTRPENIAFFDFDGKSASLAAQFKKVGTPFYVYHDMVSLAKGLKPLELYELVEKLLAEMFSKIKEETGSEFIPIIIFDGFSPRMDDALTEKAATMDLLGRKVNMEQFKFPARYEWVKAWLQGLVQKTTILYITSHIKEVRAENGRAIPGMFKAKSRAPIRELATFAAWLFASHKHQGAPVALILKRDKRFVIDEYGIQAVNIFPPKMSPLSWRNITNYWQNPIGDRPLTSDETPTAEEMYLLDGQLSPDQRIALNATLALPALKESELEPDRLELSPLEKAVKELKAKGITTPPAIKAELESTYGITATVPEIVVAYQKS